MDPTTLEAALTKGLVASDVRAQILRALETNGAWAWPIDEQTLAAHLGRALAAGQSNLAWDDVSLAFAAAHRVPTAWSLLEKRVGGALRTALSRILPAAHAEDLEQTIFTELAGPNSPLLTYLGRGPLAGWLVVTATRRAWKLATSQKATAPADDEALLERVADGQRDPAIELFKTQYGDTFRGCIKSAFGRLSAKDRNLLRLHHLDGVQTAELARLHGVHRATVVRWLADARQSFVSNFRDEFATKLGTPRLEIDSLARIFRSGLDISLPMESADVALSSPESDVRER